MSNDAFEASLSYYYSVQGITLTPKQQEARRRDGLRRFWNPSPMFGLRTPPITVKRLPPEPAPGDYPTIINWISLEEAQEIWP